MYNFKKLKELRRKATTDEKMNGSFVRDVGVQPKDPQTAIQEHSLQELSKHKLARYQMKAAENLRFKAVDHGAAIAQAAAAGGDMKKNDPDMGKRSKKLDKRIIGISRAANKLTQKTNEETLDELEQKTYMSYLSKSRGRVKSKPSVAKSRGHAIKKTPEIHKRLFGDKQYEKQMKKMSEDGHADVASALRKCKTIMEDASDIHTKLAMMGTMDSLPSWWTNKLAVAAAYMDSMRDYLLYPTNEEVEVNQIGEMRYRHGILKIKSNTPLSDTNSKPKKDQKYLKKLKQTKDQATLGDMSTGMQKGGFQGRGMYEAKKVKTMKKVARDKLIGKKDPFEPEPNITTQVIRTDSPDNVVK